MGLVSIWEECEGDNDEDYSTYLMKKPHNVHNISHKPLEEYEYENVSGLEDYLTWSDSE